MPEFCEYIGTGGAVCLQHSVRPLEGELLRYCETHRCMVERAKRQRLLQHKQKKEGERPARQQRSLSDPFLRWGAAPESETVRPSDRVEHLDEEDDAVSNRRVSWARAPSSPARLERQYMDALREHDPRAQQPELTGLHEPYTRPLSAAASDSGRGRKRVRVRKIHIPTRVEILDGLPASPPRVWYVRLGEGDAADGDKPHEDDEIIEVDDDDAYETLNRQTAAEGVAIGMMARGA